MMKHHEEKLRQMAMAHLREGEQLQQVIPGGIPSAFHARVRVFTVTDQRILVLDGKSDAVVAEMPRSAKLIPAKAGRFDLAKAGGLSGLTSFWARYPYGEKVMFGWPQFRALLAADGREGESLHVTKPRLIH